MSSAGGSARRDDSAASNGNGCAKEQRRDLESPGWK
jgi:hypothetical protein